METIKWAVNEMPETDDRHLSIMALDEIKKARTFHESFPQYSKTPLARLDQMAGYLGLNSIYVKDESYRFGLNAFKVLGGSFSMARYIAKETGKKVEDLPYNVLTSEALKKEFGQATFFTATDGNHGRGVAWAANKLGQKAVVFMPKGSTQTRLRNILAENAQATIEEVNYDECVRMAAAAAKETPHGVVVQDTAWDGYEEIPSWIMQGYGTMAMEADEQLSEDGCGRLPMCSSRPASDLWPEQSRATLPTAIRKTRRKLSWSKPNLPHASTKVPQKKTEASRSWTVICRPSWPGLPAGNRIPSPGIS